MTGPLDHPDAEVLDDHDRLIIVETRLDLVDERLTSPAQAPMDRQRAVLIAFCVVWLSSVAALTLVLWSAIEAVAR